MHRTFGLLLICGLLALANAVTRAEPAADDAAIGIWSSQLSFPAGMRGDLSLSKGNDTWRATLGGVEVMSPAAPHMKFTFPNDGGELRIALDGNNLHAFWITPSIFFTPTREPRAGTPRVAATQILPVPSSIS